MIGLWRHKNGSIRFIMSDNRENTEIISFFINNVELEQNEKKTLTKYAGYKRYNMKRG